MDILVIKFVTSSKINELIMMSVNIHNPIDQTNNRGSNIPSVMRNGFTCESISFGDFFLFGFKS